MNKMQLHLLLPYVYFVKTDFSVPFCAEFNKIQEHFNEMRYLLAIFFGSFVMSTASLIQKVLTKILLGFFSHLELHLLQCKLKLLNR